MATQSVRLDMDILDRVRKQIGQSRQPVSAFINIVLDNVLDQMEKDTLVTGYSLKTDSVKRMGLLSKALAKKKRKI